MNHTVGSVTFRYRDCSTGDLNHCYNPACEDDGKPLVDYLARWEDVGSVLDGAPADAQVFTCRDHQGPDYEEAKKAFKSTQKTGSAAYLTKEQVNKL